MKLMVISLVVIFICLSIWYTIIAYYKSDIILPKFKIDQLIAGMMIAAMIEVFGLAVLYVIRYMFVVM